MEWVSVIDQLPKNKQEILCITRAGDTHISTFVLREDSVEWDEPYYGQEISSPIEKVTHWMPLPKPPKKDK